nr:glycoside hydrolase family 32 protein [Metabacillus halosaccharovorans]
MNKHQEIIKKAHEELNKYKKSVSDHEWSLQYHVMPQANWMNDPNGFSMFNGEYHLFYQHHPYSPKWGPMYWGHVKSKDLVHWEHLPIALAPSEPYDIDGCFSGSAIEKDEKLYLFYTGNKWTGPDQDKDLKQVQCLAVSDDGIHFEKIVENPVIEAAPPGDIHPFHFRDPKVWKEGDYYYCVLGSQTKERIGQALLYRSPDLLKWEFVNVMARGTGNMGYMWECPDLFSLAGQDVLVMSPQGVKPEGDLYHNLHHSVYVLGNLDLQEGKFQFDQFQLLDYGFDFYAPQTTVDHLGRRILVGWMAMWESEMPEQEHDWAGAITIPRIMSIEEHCVKCVPAPELETLRFNQVSYCNVLMDGSRNFEGVDGDCLELNVLLDMKQASQFGINLRMDTARTEKTVLTFDCHNQKLTLNRDHSGKGPGGERKAPVELNKGKLQLTLFLDKSSLEVFIQNGEKVMTARIYPGEHSKGIEFFSEGEVELLKLDKWSLRRSVS